MLEHFVHEPVVEAAYHFAATKDFGSGFQLRDRVSDWHFPEIQPVVVKGLYKAHVQIWRAHVPHGFLATDVLRLANSSIKLPVAFGLRPFSAISMRSAVSSWPARRTGQVAD